MPKFMTLLVEDDPFQRTTLADLLRQEGFEVIECATAEAAELVIATSGTELRAVVTDQNLNGKMLGSELASFALEKFPKLISLLSLDMRRRICPETRSSCASRSRRLI